MKFSVIVPTFNRKEEVKELLDSLVRIENKNFEVILADGSPDEILAPVISSFRNKLEINHIHKPLLGISESRNLGAANANGDFVLFFDSDCVIPVKYFEKVNNFIEKENPDAYGGPDTAAGNFTAIQKAISYTMTSFLTTGGIRGKKTNTGGKFYPRSFNMGIKKEIFDKINGFSLLKVSEDIDLSIRMFKNGYKVCLIPDAFVYHKRRTNFKQFFRQVFRFGAGRINIGNLHKGELKLTHTIPALFLLFILSIPVSLFINKLIFNCMSALLMIYIVLLFFNSLIKNKSLWVGFLSIISMFVQFAGYGSGFIINFWKVKIRKKEPVLF